MPLLPRLLVGCLLVLVGVALVTTAVLGARGRLPRNRWAGVRTSATLASDAAFALAQRVAAAPLGAAGAVAVAGGAVLIASPATAGLVVLGVAVVAVLVLAGTAGMLGDRAAERVRPEPAPAACAGTCGGCDLVAGCRDAVEAGPVTSPRSPDRP